VSAKRVLSLGQCLADHGAIGHVLRNHFGAEFVGVDTATEALTRLQQEAFDLILVNRILDADGSLGVEVIRRLKDNMRLAEIPVMLVSNYADAQEEAEQAGAVRGFGKAALGQPPMMERLRLILNG
jgi:CheY-like chemotaxis protein